MTEQLDDRARRAGAAVAARTEQLAGDAGLDRVVRRGRRPRPAIGLAVLLVLALAVPGAAWLRGLAETRVELAPADEPDAGVDPDPDAAGPPQGEATEPDSEPAERAVSSLVPGGPEPLGTFGTEPVSDGNFPLGGGQYALLTDVRVAGHDGFDRVVLEFDGPDMPSYQVGFVEPPIIQDGSGDEIAVAGEAFLELALTPASGVDSVGTEWVPVYEGPFRVTGRTGVVTEVVRTGDFEAMLGWAVGLRARQPFAVSVLPDPWRLVVDIQTG